MTDEFDRLHPSLKHHVVNTLGWRSLRPLQLEAIEPVMSGQHAILLAPTAGGKTEGACFPVLSRMAEENWRPTSVLYLAPLKALLNNLLPRLETYTGYVGRRVGLWHGDATSGERTRMLGDPPDVLLTTPESIEAMLISQRVDHVSMFANVQMVVVDEVHAFAGADRGWHLLAVLERLTRIAGRDLPRVGLSATVGNPDELADWLSGSSQLPRTVVNPAAESVAEPEVGLDFVGSLDNAATVIARLHRGEKRLVFVDSRRRAEELAAALRARNVTTFVSHGSLGHSERRRSEQAFAEASNCVIVATSTLELGIDVGDLDRVIQIDAPPTVAGFLQRIGRTGRRTGSSRNALFLATSPKALLNAAALLTLWADGFVEPAQPPPVPAHLLAQQVLALTLQEARQGLGERHWLEWLGTPSVFDQETIDWATPLVEHLLDNEWLHSDTGVLSPGQRAESTIGRRNFLELTSVFVADPLVSIRHGRVEIGVVPDIGVAAVLDQEGPPVLLLAGRSWKLGNVDWRRRVAQVEPIDGAGKIQFAGTVQPLSYEMCQAVARVLSGTDPSGVELSRRAAGRLSEERLAHGSVRPGRTRMVATADGYRWYTYAGLRANLELAARVSAHRTQVSQRDNLSITLADHVDKELLRKALDQPASGAELDDLLGHLGVHLKLEEALPEALVTAVSRRRFRDDLAVQRTLDAPIDVHTG